MVADAGTGAEYNDGATGGKHDLRLKGSEAGGGMN
jgi:hypothetical protein